MTPLNDSQNITCLLGLGGVPVGVVALEILLGVYERASWSVRSVSPHTLVD